MEIDPCSQETSTNTVINAASSMVQSTNSTSHLRTSFHSAPTDRTGELVRFLDDISVVTQCISAYVAQDAAYDSNIAGCNDRVTDPLSHSLVAKVHQRRLDPAVATRHMYKSLSHDGYACAIIESHTETPLTFPQQALHGG